MSISFAFVNHFHHFLWAGDKPLRCTLTPTIHTLYELFIITDVWTVITAEKLTTQLCHSLWTVPTLCDYLLTKKPQHPDISNKKK